MKSKSITFRIDAELKEQVELVMSEVGLSMSSAFSVFCKAIVREGGMPASLLVDPFYSKGNLDELKRRIKDYESGTAQMIEMTMEELEAEIYE